VEHDTRLTSEVVDRLREAEALLTVATAVNSTLDVPEALRRICRALALLLGADTAAAYRHDTTSDQLVPVAGYHVPKELLQTLLGAPLPLREQGFHIPIWRERRAVLSEDVAVDPRFSHELFRRFRHQSGLLLPLVLDDRVAGAFYLVWWTTRRQLTERECELVESVAAQVAVLLRNAGRFEKAERERFHLEVMYELARRLAAVEDTDQLLALLVDEAAGLLGAEAAGLRLVDGGELVIAARTDSAAALMTRPRIKLGESLSGRVVSTGEAMAVEDLVEDTRYDPADKQAAVDLGFHGYLGVPLRLHGGVIGALNVFTKQRRQFTADDTALLSALADQASLAIHKARLLREAEEARGVVEGLYRVAVSMQTAPGREERLRVFTLGVHEAVGFDRIAVFLLGGDGARLELATVFGEEERSLPPALPLSPAAGVLFRVMETRRPIAVLEDADLALVPPLDADHARHPYLRARRFVVAPLVVGERAIGVAIADNKPSRRPISPANVEPFSLLCQHLATALEEARLYADSRAREQEATKLYEITSALASSLDADRILDQIVAKTVDLLGSDAAGIYMYDEARGGLTFRRGLNLDPRLTRHLVLAPGEGVCGRAYAERRPAWTRDWQADTAITFSPANEALSREAAPRAFLAVPIVIRGEVLGVLQEHFFAPHDFSAKDVRLLSTLADHAAIAMDNARHYEEVRTQRIRLTQIFDSTSDGIVLVSRSGGIEAANRRAGELLGIGPEHVGLGRGGLMAAYRAAIPDGELTFEVLRAIAEDPEREAEGDLELRTRGRILHWVARPTRNALGAVVGVTLTVRDVTHEREVSQMKSDFVSFVTHQLRTPLAGIKWMLELAAQEPALPADAGAYVQDARDAAQRLIGLVNDLLDVSRLERGKLTIARQAVRLGELTQSVLDETSLLVRDKGQALSVAGAAEIPAVTADPQLMRQVVLNLVSNAIKYTPAGGTIAIAMGRDGGLARWSITDTGLGVPAACQARLFEKFYRADNVTAIETEGTGLGLYLVRLIMEQLGGRVWCESHEGQGATFVVTLPLAA